MKTLKINREKFILLMVAGIWMAAFLTFCFTDITDCLDNGVLLYRAIRTGQFRHFYSYTLSNSSGVYAANYEVPIYILFMIWNLPSAIAADHGFDYMNSVRALLWCKLLIVLVVFIVFILICKIFKELTEQGSVTKTQWALLFFSSPLILFPTMISCQYDCIGILFMLAGLYFCLKDKDVWWVLFFAIAFPFKSFSLFIFLPVLLYKEKNIIKFLLKLGGMFLPTVFLHLFFASDPAYTYLIGAQIRDAVEIITSSVIKTGGVSLNPFIVVYTFICIVCLLNKYDRNHVIYICALVFVSFILLVNIRKHWAFLSEPFIILLIALDRERFRKNVFIHSAGSICGLIHALYCCPYEQGMNKLILGRLLSEPEANRFGDFRKMIKMLGIGQYAELLFAVFFVMYIILIFINSPFVKGKKFTADGVLPSPVASFLIRTVSLYIMVGLLIYAVYVPGDVPVFNTMTFIDYSLLKEADLSGEVTVSQPFQIKEAAVIKEVDLLLNRPGDYR